MINSVNLEDGIDKFNTICQLSKKYGTALVALTIDEIGMAKTRKQKVDMALRMYDLAVNEHHINPKDLVFDLLTFTVGSGDEEYRTAAVETIEAIRELRKLHPEVGTVLGLSNISFGLDKHAREYLNSVFLHHCVQAGLTMAILNAKSIIPMHKMTDEDIKVCEDLLFDKREKGFDPLFVFIDYFSSAKERNIEEDDTAYQALNTEEKIAKLLLDGDKERMLPLVLKAKDTIDPATIVNKILIDAMKVVGELFGSGQMQLPFVLQSAETMKSAVDSLNPYLPKVDKAEDTTLILGTVKGDVHDVGKNLVDIILTNNGYKVINLGIKVGLENYLRTLEENNAHAIGMSGLLVKSTLVMKENLETLQKKGIKKPVLLGGAALTKNFIEEYCRPIYDGPIFYCKDAFDGMEAMARIEKWNGTDEIDTFLGNGTQETIAVVKKEIKKINFEDVIPLKTTYPTPEPPFWGRKVFTNFDQRLAYEWINEKILFKSRWGYKSKGLTDQEWNKQLEGVIKPLFANLKLTIKEKNLFDPTIIYGYYPVRSQNDTLYIFSPEEGFLKREDANKEKLEDIKQRAIATLTFPRQQKKPHRGLADYFRSDSHDVLAVTLVSAGRAFSQYEAELYKENKYHEYYLAHGLSVELAEALAEIAHKNIRMELGILQKEKASLYDIKMTNYQGKRYSPGYAACPDLELSLPIFKLLKPEEFGITLSETFQIDPEQSTSAFVVYHPDAMYYTI
jgi:5-methyltetrahydrofolate--homocysteine methyltransferase